MKKILVVFFTVFFLFSTVFTSYALLDKGQGTKAMIKAVGEQMGIGWTSQSLDATYDFLTNNTVDNIGGMSFTQRLGLLDDLYNYVKDTDFADGFKTLSIPMDDWLDTMKMIQDGVQAMERDKQYPKEGNCSNPITNLPDDGINRWWGVLEDSTNWYILRINLEPSEKPDFKLYQGTDNKWTLRHTTPWKSYTYYTVVEAKSSYPQPRYFYSNWGYSFAGNTIIYAQTNPPSTATLVYDSFNSNCTEIVPLSPEQIPVNNISTFLNYYLDNSQIDNSNNISINIDGNLDFSTTYNNQMTDDDVINYFNGGVAPDEKPDLDGDGIPDDIDNDIDGDGHKNDNDAFPYDEDRWEAIEPRCGPDEVYDSETDLCVNPDSLIDDILNTMKGFYVDIIHVIDSLQEHMLMLIVGTEGLVDFMTEFFSWLPDEFVSILIVGFGIGLVAFFFRR